MVLSVLGGASRLDAQESLVALGNVSGTGTLNSSANTVGAVVASSRTATGDFLVTVTAAGAFAGATAADFLVETAIRSTGSGDIVSNAAVSAVDDDVLTVRVRTADVESAASPNLAVAANANFAFAIRRVNSASLTAVGDSRFLVAAGHVSLGGSLVGGFGVGGVVPTTLRADAGDYFLTLTKAGAFQGDGLFDYVVLLSAVGSANADEAVRGGVSSVSSDDSVTINIHTDDVQTSGGDSGSPVSTAFVFAVYRLEAGGATGAPTSRLNAALASISTGGDKVFAQSVFPGAVALSSRPATGHYEVDFIAANAFGSVSPNRFVPLVGLNSATLRDELIKANVSIPDANTLRVSVFIDDVQEGAASQGVATNAAFFLSLVDTAPVMGHDLTISPKKAPSAFRGAGILNATGVGQTIRLPLVRTKVRKVFFASKNIGRSVDDLRVKGQAIGGPLDSRFFLTTAGRRNVTSQVKIGAVASQGVRPGETAAFEGRIRYKKAARTPKIEARLRAISASKPAFVDVARLRVEPR